MKIFNWFKKKHIDCVEEQDPFIEHINKFLPEEDKAFIEKGKKHWILPVLKDYKGGVVQSETIIMLLNKVIESTWYNAVNYYNIYNVQETKTDNVRNNNTNTSDVRIQDINYDLDSIQPKLYD